MQETLWYALLLVLQALQPDPQVHDRTVYLEVYIGSSLAWNLEFHGSYTDGSIQDARNKKTFGEFEAMRRDGKQFTVLAAGPIPEEIAAKAMAGSNKDAPDKGGASTSGAPKSPAKKDSGKKDDGAPPKPFILDFTKSLALLAPLNQKFELVVPFPQAAELLGGSDDAKDTKDAKLSGSSKQTTAPKASSSAKPTSSASPSPKDVSGKADLESATFHLYRYPTHWVLTGDFMQLIIVITEK